MAEIGTNERVDDLLGDNPSPTLLIDGIDVASGMPLRDGASCRLDLPTRTQILDALTGGREGRRSRGADWVRASHAGACQVPQLADASRK
jgi:hypothetical protein